MTIAALWYRVERQFEAPSPVEEQVHPPFVALYPWLAGYDTKGYLEMVATQSSYALMEPARRFVLFAHIGELVDSPLNGHVTKQYVTVLVVAHRR